MNRIDITYTDFALPEPVSRISLLTTRIVVGFTLAIYSASELLHEFRKLTARG